MTTSYGRHVAHESSLGSTRAEEGFTWGEGVKLWKPIQTDFARESVP